MAVSTLISGLCKPYPAAKQFLPTPALPATTELSTQISKDLQRRGFKFVGNTICYAFMQAIGMVNDHAIECFRHQQLGGSPETMPTS